MDEDRVIAAIAGLRGVINELRAEVNARLGELHTELDNTSGELRADMIGLRTVLMTKFELIEDRLTSMREDITVNMMAVNVETTKRNADRSEVTQPVEMVSAMHRQLRRMRTDLDELRKAR